MTVDHKNARDPGMLDGDWHMILWSLVLMCYWHVS